MGLAQFGKSAIDLDTIARIVEQGPSVKVVFRDGSWEIFEDQHAAAFRAFVGALPEAASLAASLASRLAVVAGEGPSDG